MPHSNSHDTQTSTYDQATRVAGDLAENPLAILVGGLAVGAIAGALLPRSQREKELLAPLGRRIGDTALVAVQAARQAGMAKLEEAGLTKDAAREQAKGLFDGVTKAVGSAGSAAAKAATGKPDVAAPTA